MGKRNRKVVEAEDGLTVEEVIDKLSKLPPKAKVYIYDSEADANYVVKSVYVDEIDQIIVSDAEEPTAQELEQYRIAFERAEQIRADWLADQERRKRELVEKWGHLLPEGSFSNEPTDEEG
jgi:hypothetical protein